MTYFKVQLCTGTASGGKAAGCRDFLESLLVTIGKLKKQMGEAALTNKHKSICDLKMNTFCFLSFCG